MSPLARIEDAPAAPRSLKEHDTIVAVFFASRVATMLLPLARRSGIAPSGVTLASFTLSLAGAALLASGSSGIGVAACILAGFVLDCLDGMLARATGRASDFGRWLDSITDLVKVFALVAALVVRAVPDGDGAATIVLGGIALLGYFLCELHAQIARQLPQRPEAEYAARAAPWRSRVRPFGQTIDLAFAIGEVLTTIALAAALDRPRLGLAVLAVATPVQFASYGIRFWRHRFAGPTRT